MISGIVVVMLFSLPFYEEDGANYMFERPSPTPIYCNKLDENYITGAMLSVEKTEKLLMNYSASSLQIQTILNIDIPLIVDALKTIQLCLISS